MKINVTQHARVWTVGILATVAVAFYLWLEGSEKPASAKTPPSPKAPAVSTDKYLSKRSSQEPIASSSPIDPVSEKSQQPKPSAECQNPAPTITEYFQEYTFPGSDGLPELMEQLLQASEVDESGKTDVLISKMLQQCELYLDPGYRSTIEGELEQGVLESGGDNGAVMEQVQWMRDQISQCEQIQSISNGLDAWSSLNQAVEKGNTYAASMMGTGLYSPPDFEDWSEEKKQEYRTSVGESLLNARRACELQAFSVLGNIGNDAQSDPKMRYTSNPTIEGENARAVAIEKLANKHAENLVMFKKFSGAEKMIQQNNALGRTIAERAGLGDADIEEAMRIGGQYFESYCTQ